METAIILGAIVQIVTLIVFFVMASNIAKIKEALKIQLERTLFDSEYYLNLMKEVNKIEMPQYEGFNDTNSGRIQGMFLNRKETEFVYCEFGRYSCFFGEREVYFRTKEDAIKALYLFVNRSK